MENSKKQDTYLCDMCQTIHEGNCIERKVDSPFNLATHGKVCKICPSCAPYAKEWNEAQDRDLNDNPYKYW